MVSDIPFLPNADPSFPFAALQYGVDGS